MAEIIGVSCWTLAGILWGDWRHWRKYHSTILFFVLCDTFYYYATYTYRLWSLQPTWPLRSEMITLVGEFIVFASTTLIFLGRYPEGRLIAPLWTLLWIFIYTMNEWGLRITGTITYNHGWRLFYSLLFNVLMFVFLRLHNKKPLLTYGLSIPITVLLLVLFRIPIK